MDGWLTICNFTVLPSSSMVLIFCVIYQQVFALSSQRETDAYKVDTDCGNVGLGVGVIGKSQEQARLSNTGVTDEEQLEEVIVSARVVNSLFQAHKKSGFSWSCRWRGWVREMLYKSVSTIRGPLGEEGCVYGRPSATYYSGFMVTDFPKLIDKGQARSEAL